MKSLKDFNYLLSLDRRYTKTESEIFRYKGALPPLTPALAAVGLVAAACVCQGAPPAYSRPCGPAIYGSGLDSLVGSKNPIVRGATMLKF